MSECEPLIQKGFILRNVLTLLVLFVLFFSLSNKSIRKYLFLILPILLTLSDNSDNYFLYSFEDSLIPTKKSKCAKTFYYHQRDKISDSLGYVWTYLFLFFFLQGDPFLLFFVLYRIVGVGFFSYTKDSSWLVLFFDFVKEYLLYLFVFGKNFTYLPFFIALKILYEYLFHSIVNPSHY
jgi:hypothetical protein